MFKKGDIVEMTHNWAHIGRPLGSTATVLEVKNDVVHLLPKENHHGRFAFSFVKLYRKKVINLEDFYNKY